MESRLLDADRRQLSSYYGGLLAEHGDSPRAVAWGTAAAQQYRFKVLAEVGDVEAASVLDVGCGKGDLYEFLYCNGFRGSYAGLDISPELLDFARQKYSHLRFLEGEIHEHSFDETFDYVLMSGIFNLAVSNSQAVLEATLRKAFDLCRKAIAFNLVSTYVNWRDESFFYASPEEVFRFCKTSLSRYVTLRHDYMPFGFTVYVYRKSDWGL